MSIFSVQYLERVCSPTLLLVKLVYSIESKSVQMHIPMFSISRTCLKNEKRWMRLTKFASFQKPEVRAETETRLQEHILSLTWSQLFLFILCGFKFK
jgi:hypothetical protein